MSKIVAICNQKGGVSKTTTTFSLCTELVKSGKRVLAIDGDQQASLSLLFGIVKPDDLDVSLTNLFLAQMRDMDYDIHSVIKKTPQGVDLLPSSITLSQTEMELMNHIGRESVLKKILAHTTEIDGKVVPSVTEEYDYIIIDCPPSLGIITVNILTAADCVLIPVQASIFSVAGMTMLLKTISKIKENTNPNLYINGMLFSMVQANTNITNDVIFAVKSQYGDNLKIYETMIPRSIKAENAAADLQSITDFEPSSKLAHAYKSLTEEFLKSFGDYNYVEKQ